jgi:hypothetical protein
MRPQHIGVFIEQRAGVLHDVGLELLGKASELIEALLFWAGIFPYIRKT